MLIQPGRLECTAIAQPRNEQAAQKTEARMEIHSGFGL
jgi:hypothetical protein